MKNYIRKSIMIFAAMCLFLSGCGSSDDEYYSRNIETKDTSAEIGSQMETKETDVVLLMDESGSMLHADKDRLAIEGAKMFIDMEKISDVNVALIEFSNEIKSTGLVEMSQLQNKEYIKSILDGVKYTASAYTDTGAGLLEAVSVLDNVDNGHEKAVILFTDGRTDIDDNIPGRTTEDSEADVDKAVQMAVEKGYTIYCIGLNADGKVNEEELGKIAITTGGQYHIVTDVNELPDFFNQIFADIDDSQWKPIDEFDADGDFHDVAFSIDNENVMEANIVILSSQQIEDITLTDYSGSLVDIAADDKVVFTTSSKYSLIKLIYPGMGEWSISVKGVSGDHIKVALLYNYDVSIIVKTDQTETVPGNFVYIRAYLASGGEVMEDNSFYSNMSGYYSAENLVSGETRQEEIELNGEGNMFEKSVSFDTPGEYSLYVHLEGNGFYRESEPFTIHVSKRPVVVLGELPEVKLKAGKAEELDLNEYFMDEDGDVITYSISGKGESLHAELDGSVLQMMSEETGETGITICADNGSNEKIYKDISVTTVSFASQAIKIVLPVLAAAVLLLIIYFISKGKEKLSGAFKITIESATHDEYGNTALTSYPILNPIQASSVGKRSFTLEKLMHLVQGYYMAMEYDAERKVEFARCMEMIMPESGKVKVQGSKRNFELKLTNNSAKVKFTTMNIVTNKKVLVIAITDNNMGIGMAQEKEFGIRFTEEDGNYAQVSIVYSKM